MFDLQTARDAAAWCQRAYTEADAACPALDAYAIVRDAGPHIVVAFRGTTNIKGWLQDFNCAMDRVSEGGCVHHGFNRVEGCVHGQVAALVKELPSKPVRITGHSLGAACAARCASQWSDAVHELECVYTFGQPRAGDAAWARQYDARLKGVTWRVVDEADVVARVPLLLMGYRFQGREAFLPAGRTGVETDPTLWQKLASLWATVKWEWRHGGVILDDLVTDHPIHRYLDRLAEVEA